LARAWKSSSRANRANLLHSSGHTSEGGTRGQRSRALETWTPVGTRTYPPARSHLMLLDTDSYPFRYVFRCASWAERHCLGISGTYRAIPPRGACPLKISSITLRIFSESLSLISGRTGLDLGGLVQWVGDVCRWTLEIIKRNTDFKGFVVQPRRWVRTGPEGAARPGRCRFRQDAVLSKTVERSLAGFTRCRRLVRDFEGRSQTTESWVYLASIQLLLRRLDPS